jgi:hypothetical protein
MNRLWNKSVVMALGAVVLMGSAAWAQQPPKNMKLPPQQPRPANLSCAGHCKADTKECLDLCDTHAKQAGSICTNACMDMEKECQQDCKQSERGQ